MQQTETETIFLARQPILDGKRRVVAYELLFRPSSSAETAEIESPEAATARVAVDAFLNMGAKTVLGKHRGFVNVDLGTIFSETVLALPAERVVLEVLEQVPSVALDRCRELRNRGFEIALDDYVPGDARETMLEIADYVKVDLQLTPRDQLPTLARALRRPGLKLLAEKVETEEEADFCSKLGFDLYQGYFFARPTTLSGRKFDPARAPLLQAFNALSVDTDLGTLEQIFKREPSLGISLLRVANSAGLGSREKITSLSHAIMYVGRTSLRRWMLLLLCGGDEGGLSRGPLFEMAATRGRLLELVVPCISRVNAPSVSLESAFLTGMLSLADAILGVEMADLLDELNIEDLIRDALLDRQGPLGSLLDIVERLEQGRFAELAALLHQAGLETEQLAAAQRESYTWFEALDAEQLATG